MLPIVFNQSQKNFVSLFAIVLLMLLPLLFFLAQKLNSYAVLSNDLDKVKFKVEQLKQSPLLSMPITENMQIISTDPEAELLALRELAGKNNLNLTRSDCEEKPQETQLVLQLEGGYLGFLEFFRSYLGEQTGYVLKDLAISKNRNKVLIDAHLTQGQIDAETI